MAGDVSGTIRELGRATEAYIIERRRHFHRHPPDQEHNRQTDDKVNIHRFYSFLWHKKNLQKQNLL